MSKVQGARRIFEQALHCMQDGTTHTHAVLTGRQCSEFSPTLRALTEGNLFYFWVCY